MDREIVALLKEDARISNRETARRLGISDTLVRKRLRRLSESGLAKITAVTDYVAMGHTTTALVRVVSAPKVAREVVEEMAKFEQISFAALTTGRFNIVLLLSARSRREVADIIHKHLRSWSGVHMVETLELVETVKHRLDVALVVRDK
ncbi:Lrp/AsnC family transcriptional regulator [Novosphingobium sp. HII-3]|uniref:Lrp/AsnC family transcriptional regulator n=1 Tax=Novosphingobium sp. HII-3 TaxID=2075565 RepID=UPI001304C54C|nr:Lrp/AsnC family transcriptional regulator [Novosphingobium sp. HII-3]